MNSNYFFKKISS